MLQETLWKLSLVAAFLSRRNSASVRMPAPIKFFPFWGFPLIKEEWALLVYSISVESERKYSFY